MHIILNIYVIYVALMIGGTIPVLAYRLPIYLRLVRVGKKERLSITSVYSYCPYCLSKISWFYKTPIIGIFLCQFKCKSCKRSISLKYLTVEVIYLLITIYMLYKYNLGSTFVFMITFAYIGLLLAIIDYKLMLLPNVIVFSLLVVGIIYISAFNPQLLLNSTLGAVSAFLVFYAIYAFYYFVLKRLALGFGDVKLVFVLGFWCGFKEVPFIFICSAALLVVYVLLGGLWSKAKNNMLNQKVPYGPFLIFSAFIALNNPSISSFLC
ncbi:MAG: prepilin peptidase [Candidatus Lariskella arthropodorum]